jgi:hypothetical protein
LINDALLLDTNIPIYFAKSKTNPGNFIQETDSFNWF